MDRRRNDWPKRTKALPVEDGIKAHTKRGAFGQRWWSKRWIGMLENFGLGGRLARGRTYARGGQVSEIVIESGGVRAKVQGSRAKPYDVTIRMRELSASEWSAIGRAIAANGRLSAMLLAGEMPEDIESAFSAAGTALFPQRSTELKTACSCPDWSNPCKHVAAVFYLVGEEVDRDPFLLFALRGLERPAMASLIAGPHPGVDPLPRTRRKTAANGKRRATEPAEASNSPDHGDRSPDETSLDPATFWTGVVTARGPIAGNGGPGVKPPKADALLVARAGRFPFWRSRIALDESVTPLYARATETALNWLAEHLEPGTPDEIQDPEIGPQRERVPPDAPGGG
jgi:uncharacterized Zn finger protein